MDGWIDGLITIHYMPHTVIVLPVCCYLAVTGLGEVTSVKRG